MGFVSGTLNDGSENEPPPNPLAEAVAPLSDVVAVIRGAPALDLSPVVSDAPKEKDDAGAALPAVDGANEKDDAGAAPSAVDGANEKETGVDGVVGG
jgi:hypothetical protein